MNAILDRRSIRSYTDELVSEKDIDDLLVAAMSAPSAGNQQPWHYIVLRQRTLLDAIPTFHPYSHVLRNAGVAIVICGDVSLEVHKGFWVQDCSAAAQNILLTVQEKGLGAVWLGVYPMEERVNGMKELLNLPDSVIPLAIIPVGYPSEPKARANRYNPTRIHYDVW